MSNTHFTIFIFAKKCLKFVHIEFLEKQSSEGICCRKDFLENVVKFIMEHLRWRPLLLCK